MEWAKFFYANVFPSENFVTLKLYQYVIIVGKIRVKKFHFEIFLHVEISRDREHTCAIRELHPLLLGGHPSSWRN